MGRHRCAAGMGPRAAAGQRGGGSRGGERPSRGRRGLPAPGAPAASPALAVISPIRQPRIRRPFLVIAGLVLLCVATLGAAIEWALPMFETGALFPAREYRPSGGQRETVLLPDG